jgi:hypothetical protein
MRRLTTFAFFALSLSSTLALAQPYKKLLSQAAESLENAEQAARRAGGPCRRTVAAGLDVTTNHVYALRKNRGDVQAVKLELSAIASNAAMARCPFQVTEAVQRASATLEEVRVSMWKEHHGRGNDWDRDDENPLPPPAAAPPPPFAELGPLTVQPAGAFENEPAVRVALPELRMTGMQGHPFYLAARFRSGEGTWSDWVKTQQWTVNAEPFVWRNAYQHFFRYSTLAEEDFSEGRFVADVGVFDGFDDRELASREVSFRVRLPSLPPPPPQIPVPEDRGPIATRDCGTGNDPGCMMSRAGEYPMDAVTFDAVMRSLRANPSELVRSQVVQTIFQRNAATALQFGLMLDLFPNELLRLTVAQAGAHRVVNPQYALGFSSKWANPMLQAQYTEILLGHARGGPPPPMQNPAPTYPPRRP